MEKRILLLLFVTGLYMISTGQERLAPAYPLINHDTYFSIWSTTDQLNGSVTKHWTGANQSLTGLARVDGKVYRFMGAEGISYRTVLAAGDERSWSAKYTETEPAGDWKGADYRDESWKAGSAPFGDNARTDKTMWRSKEIWVRRTFTLDKEDYKQLLLKTSFDDNVEIYLNGEEIYRKVGVLSHFGYFTITETAKQSLRKGQNVLAMHCTNTGGASHLDAGLVVENPVDARKAAIVLAEQKNVGMNATQTMYDMTCGPVELSVTFTSPLILTNLDLLSRPVSYISYAAKSNDGNKHAVQLYFGASTDIAVNMPFQEVAASGYTSGDLKILKAGTKDQPVLKKKGDDLRIDWGYMYTAIPRSYGGEQYITPAAQAMGRFLDQRMGRHGRASAVRTAGSAAGTAGKPRSAAGTATNAPVSGVSGMEGRDLVLSTILPLGDVGSEAVERFILIGYDDIYAIQYFGTDLRPWWRNDPSQTIEKQLALAANEYKSVMDQCSALNTSLHNDAVKAGGENYASLCEIAYRQSISAHKLVKSPQGELLWLSKENFSNGCINTVDVSYPSAPLYLVYNPKLLEGMMSGIFYFSESGKYTRPYAAHDLGTYPLANGEVYGEGQEGMPVEESGNMLIMAAAIAKAEGNPEFARKHWKTLTTWAEYLNKSGFDPANQLCTDDFAGHLARNANLSVKAIEGLGCYAMLAEQLGDKETAEKYRSAVRDMVPKWTSLADAGDHYALTFNDRNTWSQKYNMVWDKVLGLHLFPESVYEKETKYYLTRQNVYGLPLDSRQGYTKSDWVLWTACLAGTPAEFTALTDPMLKYARETSSRVPISDWHKTVDGTMMGMQARSVVGGYFMKMLEDKMKGAGTAASVKF